jgi:hypothetical protein
MTRRRQRSKAAAPESRDDLEDSSRSHAARKALFARALRRGWLTLAEIDDALPAGTLSQPERWLLLASLKAANVELRQEPPGARKPQKGAA